MTLQLKTMNVASEIGGITAYDAAMQILEKKMDGNNLEKIKQVSPELWKQLEEWE